MIAALILRVASNDTVVDQTSSCVDVRVAGQNRPRIPEFHIEKSARTGKVRSRLTGFLHLYMVGLPTVMPLDIPSVKRLRKGVKAYAPGRGAFAQ